MEIGAFWIPWRNMRRSLSPCKVLPTELRRCSLSRTYCVSSSGFVSLPSWHVLILLPLLLSISVALHNPLSTQTFPPLTALLICLHFHCLVCRVISYLGGVHIIKRVVRFAHLFCLLLLGGGSSLSCHIMLDK